LIYSDPRDDGYSGGETFPKGAWRPKDGVQRGSVQDSAVFMGDPLTPELERRRMQSVWRSKTRRR